MMKKLLASVALAALALAPISAAEAQVNLLLNGPQVDTVVRSLATNRSAVIGFNSTASAASSSSTSLNVAVTSNFVSQAGARSGIPMVGQNILGSGIPTGTTILAVADNGSNGFTLTLSAAATVSSGATVTSAGPQQVMAANPARRGFSQQNQGTGDCYQNGTGTASVGPDSLKVATNTYYESKDSHVGTGAIADQCSVPATPMFIREW